MAKTLKTIDLLMRWLNHSSFLLVLSPHLSSLQCNTSNNIFHTEHVKPMLFPQRGDVSNVNTTRNASRASMLSSATTLPATPTPKWDKHSYLRC